jgi:hypothetical protein
MLGYNGNPGSAKACFGATQAVHAKNAKLGCRYSQIPGDGTHCSGRIVFLLRSSMVRLKYEGM